MEEKACLAAFHLFPRLLGCSLLSFIILYQRLEGKGRAAAWRRKGEGMFDGHSFTHHLCLPDVSYLIIFYWLVVLWGFGGVLLLLFRSPQQFPWCKQLLHRLAALYWAGINTPLESFQDIQAQLLSVGSTLVLLLGKCRQLPEKPILLQIGYSWQASHLWIFWRPVETSPIFLGGAPLKSPSHGLRKAVTVKSGINLIPLL